MNTPHKKAIISKIDKYEIHIDGDNSYSSAKTYEEAQAIAKEMEEEYKKEWQEKNSAQAKEQERLKTLSGNIDNYIHLLKRTLWNLQHTKDKTQTTLALIENYKDIIKDLKGLYEETHTCVYHAGWMNDTPYYSIEQREKE